MSKRFSLESIVSLAKRRGFVYQGSEIYGGLAGTWDYGPLGVQLKRNLADLWWKMFVEGRDDMFGLDSAILMNPKVWQASGHIATFSDPLVECQTCHGRFRADKIDSSKCPSCGSKNSFGQPRQFNMMFKTQVGPVANQESVSYLRPETAQGMFVNFKNVVDSFSPNLPFGIAQIGRAFRNEISPRDFLFRAREFEIMELEYFVRPDDWQEPFNDWRKLLGQWFAAIGLPAGRIKEVELPSNERAHYSQATVDFYYDYPSIGLDELAGLAYRGAFDLTNHQRLSGKKLEYRPKEGGKPFVPHVIEPTFGLDRNVMAVLSEAYCEDSVGGEKRVLLKLPSDLAPVRYAVSPLLKNKPELVEKARAVYRLLKERFGLVMWDDNGNIGKRYRRQDEIGTPYCVVVDFQSLQDGTVTVRDRDTTKQQRLAPEAIGQSESTH
ncbi:MAG: glycine--tRNA ligase [Candidatus Chaera renei]|uniref:glycine--tRNA ligase n=1 Tax=Candidatus Chaera renei TaxID=2506947 RepID=A0A4Q0AIV6_9BACT|nr:MAG: glycine--tRNA ligase [Candidatus Chaera renei]